MYEMDGQIRFSEADAEGKLKWLPLLNYFQDASTLQSEELGVGLTYLSEQNMAWVVNYWQIDVYQYPRVFDKIKIGTVPYEIKGFMGHRNFCIRRADSQEIMAVGNSIWTLMDMEKGRPVKATGKIASAYEMGEKLEMEYLDRKITPEGNGVMGEEIIVRKYHLDTNNHVNNGQYVLMAMNFLPETFEIKRLRVAYKKSAMLSDVIQPVVYQSEDKICVELLSVDGDIYTCVEFTS